jgi:hypothetical protein
MWTFATQCTTNRMRVTRRAPEGGGNVQKGWDHWELELVGATQRSGFSGED